MTAVRRSMLYSVDRLVPPERRAAAVATMARAARDKLIADGAAPPLYTTFVDGREGAAEETVKPEGTILYRFNVIGLAAAFALEYARARSPVQSGEYRASWFIAVDGRPYTGDVAEIPGDAVVMVTNHAPYHRRIDTGGQRGIGRKIVEDTRQAVKSRWPLLLVERQFVEIPDGYILKGGHRARKGRRLRAASRAGAVMSYPAVVIRRRP